MILVNIYDCICCGIIILIGIWWNIYNRISSWFILGKTFFIPKKMDKCETRMVVRWYLHLPHISRCPTFLYIWFKQLPLYLYIYIFMRWYMMNNSTNSIMTPLTPYFLFPSVATNIGAPFCLRRRWGEMDVLKSPNAIHAWPIVGWRHSGPVVWDSDFSGWLKILVLHVFFWGAWEILCVFSLSFSQWEIHYLGNGEYPLVN